VEASRALELGDAAISKDDLPDVSVEAMNDESSSSMVSIFNEYGERFEKTNIFAQVYPEHKFLIVESLRKRGHIVGMTGDGVNDAPALKRADVGIAVSGATDAARAAADIVLTEEGLSTIITAVFVSRKIFQRMKNFVIYRVAATQQLLFFFFFSCFLLNPRSFDQRFQMEFFSIPVFALVTITLLNDGTIISVAYDVVDGHTQPEKWNLLALYVVSSAIGLSALLGSLVFLYLALASQQPQSIWRSWFHLPSLTYEQIQTAVYLKISLSDYASVFNSRCESWLWTRRPSSIVLIAAVVAMGAATALSMLDVPWSMQKLGPRVVLFIWGYTLLFTLVQDAFKVLAYQVLQILGWDAGGDLISDEDMAKFQEEVCELHGKSKVTAEEIP
jgi:H+-transporting ATPase